MNWRKADEVRRDYIVERRRLDLRPDDDAGPGILEAFELGYQRGLADGAKAEREKTERSYTAKRCIALASCLREAPEPEDVHDCCGSGFMCMGGRRPSDDYKAWHERRLALLGGDKCQECGGDGRVLHGNSVWPCQSCRPDHTQPEKEGAK